MHNLFIRDEAITNAGFGENILWAFRVVFEFLTQLPHVDPQVFSVIGICWPPDVRENALMCEHTSAIGSEISE